MKSIEELTNFYNSLFGPMIGQNRHAVSDKVSAMGFARIRSNARNSMLFSSMGTKELTVRVEWKQARAVPVKLIIVSHPSFSFIAIENPCGGKKSDIALPPSNCK